MALTTIEQIRLDIQDRPRPVRLVRNGDGTSYLYPLEHYNVSGLQVIQNGAVVGGATVTSGVLRLNSALTGAFEINYLYTHYSDDELSNFLTRAAGDTNLATIYSLQSFIAHVSTLGAWTAPDGSSVDSKTVASAFSTLLDQIVKNRFALDDPLVETFELGGGGTSVLVSDADGAPVENITAATIFRLLKSILHNNTDVDVLFDDAQDRITFRVKSAAQHTHAPTDIDEDYDTDFTALADDDKFIANDASDDVTKRGTLLLLKNYIRRTKAEVVALIGNATSTAAGLMSSGDKSKLDKYPAIPANQSEAKDYVVRVPATTGDATLREATNVTPRGAGTGLTLDGNNLNVTNPFTDADETKLDGIATGAEVNVKSDWDASSGDAQILNKPTIPTVPARAGAFTAADETKLDGIEAGAEVNVQSDWDATSGDAQILNKPTIPTVPARAGAFTAADEAKLDGIATGAQVNPLRRALFAVIDTDTDDGINPSAIGFYNGSTQIQSGSLSVATNIYVPAHAAAYGNDPTSPGTDLSAVSTSRLFHDVVQNGGSITLVINRRGATDYMYVFASAIAAVSGGWNLSGLTIKEPLSITGTGYAWQVAAEDFRSFVALRKGLPTGDDINADSLTPDTAILHKDFDTSTIQAQDEYHDEHHVGFASFTGYTLVGVNPVTAGQVQVTGTGNVRLITIKALNDADKASIKAKLSVTKVIQLYVSDSRYEQYDMSSTVNEGIVTGNLSFNVAYNTRVVEGTAIAVGTTIALRVRGNIPSVKDMAQVAFTGEAADVSLDTASFDGNLSSADDDVQKMAQKLDDLDISGDIADKDAVPIFAAFRDRYTRNFAASASAATDAVVSTGNPAEFGVTALIGVGAASAAEAPQASAGDWIYANVGENYIIARIHGVTDQTGAGHVIRAFWFDDGSTEVHTTLRYDQLGTGAGTIAFYIREPIPSDSDFGDKAFSNPPSDLDATEKGAVRSAIEAAKTLPSESGVVGFLHTNNGVQDWRAGSLLNHYDSGTQTTTGNQAVSDTDSIPLATINASGIVATENITNFGIVYKTNALESITFTATLNATQGVAFRLRYSDTAPTGTSDAKNFGTLVEQFNANTATSHTLYNVPANRYFFYTLSGGGSRTMNVRQVRIQAAHEVTQITPRAVGNGLELSGNVVSAKAGTGITVDGSGINVTNPFEDADETKLDEIEAQATKTYQIGSIANVNENWTSLNQGNVNFGALPAATKVTITLILTGDNNKHYSSVLRKSDITGSGIWAVGVSGYANGARIEARVNSGILQVRRQGTVSSSNHIHCWIN